MSDVRELIERLRNDQSDGWSGDAICVSGELATEAATALSHQAARIEELERALNDMLACLHQPNPQDPKVWYIAPKRGPEFSAAVVRARNTIQGAASNAER